VGVGFTVTTSVLVAAAQGAPTGLFEVNVNVTVPLAMLGV
jgi:hypothetical protein